MNQQGGLFKVCNIMMINTGRPTLGSGQNRKNTAALKISFKYQ